MTAKTKVTMIQARDALGNPGQTRRVRIGDVEIPVLVAAPVVGAGSLNFTMTIADVDVAFESEPDAASAAQAAPAGA